MDPDQREQKVSDLCREIVELLHDELEDEAEKKGRDVYSLIASHIRPYLRHHASPQDSPVNNREDARRQLWTFRVYFWDTSLGEDEGAELVAESDTETLRGFASVAQAVRDYAEDMHGDLIPQDLRYDALRTRLMKLRAAISRNKGYGTLRVRYAIGREHYMCQVDVERGEGGDAYM